MNSSCMCRWVSPTVMPCVSHAHKTQVATAAAGPGFASCNGPLLSASFHRTTTNNTSSSSALNATGSGGDAAAAAAGGKPAGGKAPAKPRLPSLDSLRFFLIAYIGVGHFVAFATKDAFLLKLFSQVCLFVVVLSVVVSCEQVWSQWVCQELGCSAISKQWGFSCCACFRWREGFDSGWLLFLGAS